MESSLPVWSDLPDELVLRFLSSLPLEDLCRIQRACRRLRDLAQTQSLWEILYHSSFENGGDSSSRSTTRAEHTDASAATSTAEAVSSNQHAAASNLAEFSKLEQLGEPPPRYSSHPATAAAGAAAAAARAVLPGSSKRKLDAVTDPSTSAAATVAVDEEGVVDWRERLKARFVEQSRQQRLKRQAHRLRAEGALQMLQQEVHRLEVALAREQRQLPLLQAELEVMRHARQQASAAKLSTVFWQPMAVQQARGAGLVTDQAPQDAEGREEDLRQRLAVTELEVRKLMAALAAKRAREGEAWRKLAALQP